MDAEIPGDGHSSEERVTRDTTKHCHRDMATGTFLCHSKAIYRVILCLQGCILQCSGQGRCQPKLMQPVKRRPPSQWGYTPECRNVITHSPKTRDQGMLIQGQLFYLVWYECWILLKSTPAPSAGRIFSLPLPLFPILHFNLHHILIPIRPRCARSLPLFSWPVPSPRKLLVSTTTARLLLSRASTCPNSTIAPT